MSVNPLVSISCVTFNHAPYLRECLEGFLMQQCDFKFEILIHDDASTDGTRAIIEEYTQKYPGIFFPMYQTENQYSQGVRGMMAKFNFPRCRGKYIALCEGDDFWTDPLKLQKQVDFLERNETYSFSAHSYETLRQDGIKNQKKGEENKINYLRKKATIKLEDYIKSKSIKTLTVLFKASFIQCLDFDKMYLGKLNIKSVDWFMFYKFLVVGDCHIFHESMGVYRISPQGVSQKEDTSYLRNNLICLLKTFDFALNSDKFLVSSHKKKILFKSITRLMYYSIRSMINIDLFKYYLQITYKYFLKK